MHESSFLVAPVQPTQKRQLDTLQQKSVHTFTGNRERPFLQAQNQPRRTKSTVRRESAAGDAPTAAGAALPDADAVVLDSEDEAARPRSAGTKRPPTFLAALQQTSKSIGLGVMAALSPAKSWGKNSKDSALHGESGTSISLTYISRLAVKAGI